MVRPPNDTRPQTHRRCSFPWEMATAVSDKVFDDGVHEFLVMAADLQPGLSATALIKRRSA